MGDNEVSITGELSLGGGLVPAQGKIAVAFARRFGARGVEVLKPVSEAIGADALNERLEASGELDALVARAFVAYGNSAHSAKKRLLARIVQRAVLDDAEIDESSLHIRVLDQIDGSQIRCLEEIHRAEQKAIRSGEMGAIARGAEKPITREVAAVAEQYPDPVLRSLESLGLITGSINWDGLSVIAGTTSFGDFILDELHKVEL